MSRPSGQRRMFHLVDGTPPALESQVPELGNGTLPEPDWRFSADVDGGSRARRPGSDLHPRARSLPGRGAHRILLEDTISVGDVVNLGGHGGVVEGMSIRSVRLRDLEGTVHTVPFGEVATVLNMTKDVSFAFMEVGIAYREDVDQVVEVLREIGDGMQADEEFGPLILEPLEVLGLDSFGASSVNIRTRLKTLPIKQWGVKREYQRRMKRGFDERGIEIPFPHQTVYFGADKDGVAPAARIAFENAARADLGNPPPESPVPPEGEPERSERNWCRVSRRPRASAEGPLLARCAVDGFVDGDERGGRRLPRGGPSRRGGRLENSVS